MMIAYIRGCPIVSSTTKSNFGETEILHKVIIHCGNFIPALQGRSALLLHSIHHQRPSWLLSTWNLCTGILASCHYFHCVNHSKDLNISDFSAIFLAFLFFPCNPSRRQGGRELLDDGHEMNNFFFARIQGISAQKGNSLHLDRMYSYHFDGLVFK